MCDIDGLDDATTRTLIESCIDGPGVRQQPPLGSRGSPRASQALKRPRDERGDGRNNASQAEKKFCVFDVVSELPESILSPDGKRVARSRLPKEIALKGAATIFKNEVKTVLLRGVRGKLRAGLPGAEDELTQIALEAKDHMIGAIEEVSGQMRHAVYIDGEKKCIVDPFFTDLADPRTGGQPLTQASLELLGIKRVFYLYKVSRQYINAKTRARRDKRQRLFESDTGPN